MGGSRSRETARLEELDDEGMPPPPALLKRSSKSTIRCRSLRISAFCISISRPDSGPCMVGEEIAGQRKGQNHTPKRTQRWILFEVQDPYKNLHHSRLRCHLVG